MERGLGRFRCPLQFRRRRRDVGLRPASFCADRTTDSACTLSIQYTETARVAFSVFAPVELRIIETIAQP
jgi:hypothetical protein